MSDHNGKYAPRPGFIPGVAVNLGGNVLVLAPLGLLKVREFDERRKELQAKTDPPATTEDWFSLNTDAVLYSLQRNYPDFTREALEPLLDAGNITEAQEAVSGQSGLKKVSPGELQPAK